MRLFYAGSTGSLSRAAADFTAETFVSLILYQRDDCHLCDLALEVLAAARVPDFDSVFIDQDDALEERYGIRVPVLRREDTGAELDWPFDQERLRAFL
jgi:hypothetical protein